MKKIATLLAATAITALGANSALADKWDMPMAYAATNYHSENGAKFAACVTDGTGGKLEIVTHPGGSLFSGNDIKRAVQTGQAPIGERLISAHANENPLYGVDSIPFLATSFDDSEKLWKAAGDKVKSALDADNLVYLYAVPSPPQGLDTKKDVNSAADLKGVKFRAYNAATARIAELADMPATLILFEAPSRLPETLQALAQGLGSDRPAAVARELTKLNEELARGTLASLYEDFSSRDSIKGEVVIVVGPPPPQTIDDDAIAEALSDALQSLSLRDAAKAVSDDLKVPRKRVYDLGLKLRHGSEKDD